MPTCKRVWITGGSSGIGLALAKRYRAAGSEVIISARNVERLAAVAAELDARPLPLDVTDRAAVFAAVEKIWLEHGPLDLAVLNAGGNPAPEGGTASILEANLRLNLLSAAYGVDALRQKMREGGGGSSGATSRVAGPPPGQRRSLRPG